MATTGGHRLASNDVEHSHEESGPPSCLGAGKYVTSQNSPQVRDAGKHGKTATLFSVQAPLASCYTVRVTTEVPKGGRRACAALTASSAGGSAACGGAGGAAAAALPANPQGGPTPLTGVRRGKVLTPLPGASRSGCGGVAAAARNGLSCYCAARGRLEPNQSIMIRLYRRQRFPEVQTSYDLTSPPLRFVRPGAGLILGGGGAVTSAEW